MYLLPWTIQQQQKITQVTLTTAVEISAEKTESILAEFKAKGLIEQEVELEAKVDPSIIGGFIVQFNDQLYNASVKEKLDGNCPTQPTSCSGTC